LGLSVVNFVGGPNRPEYDCEQHSLRISWAGGQTVLSREEARDLLLFLHDDLRDHILARQEEQDEEK